MDTGQVLIMSRDEKAHPIADNVRAAGFPVDCVRPEKVSTAMFGRGAADIVLVDARPDDPDATTDVQIARHFFPELPVMVIAHQASIDTLERALTLGADDFVVMSFEKEVWCLRIRAALQRRRRAQEQAFQRERAAVQQLSDALLREMGGRLSSVVSYCVLLNMREDMPPDVSACTRHLAKEAAGLKDAIEKLARLSKAQPSQAQSGGGEVVTPQRRSAVEPEASTMDEYHNA